jgi:hypothetical protein
MPAAIGNILLEVECLEHPTAVSYTTNLKDEKWFSIDFMRVFPQGYASQPLAMPVSGRRPGNVVSVPPELGLITDAAFLKPTNHGVRRGAVQ